MPNNRLIVFSPGWSGLPKQSYNPLLRRFKKEGGFDIVSLNYDIGGVGSIEATAFQCAQFMNKLRTSYAHITFIGHSMGGLVGRVIHRDSPHLINAYVSLGSPHNGSTYSRLGAWFSKSCGQMSPGSTLLSNLAKQKDWDIPSLAISAKYDLVVPDANFYSGSPNTKNIELPLGHASLIWSKRTFYEIWSWLIYEVLQERGNNDDPGYYSEVSI
jgi:hypothetical protein